MANYHVPNIVAGLSLGERKPRINIRAQRYFSVGHNWFFNTREGIKQGPFSSMPIVKQEIEKYIKKMKIRLN